MDSLHPGSNWAGNIAYRAAELLRPRTLEELADEVASRPRVRVLGSRHSFNDLADTDGALISLEAIDRAPVELVADGVVRVPAGARHGDLVPELDRLGVALSNLASLPHISVAGAIATGTHGSGDAIGTLSTQVEAIDFIAADGSRRRVARGDEDFEGHVVHLGALGVLVSLDLNVSPSYEVAQTVFEGMTWEAALGDYEALTTSGDSVSLFTTWGDAARIDQVWVKTRHPRTAPDLSRLGALPADGPRHPIPGVDASPATEQGGVFGPWHARLPHFRLDFTPSAGAEIQAEYLVPRADLPAAIAAVQSLAHLIAPLLHVSEIRTMRADDLWLSPAYGRDTVGLHFTWKDADQEALFDLLPTLEAALPNSARPHWGKVTTLPAAEIRARYERWPDFAALAARLDPERKFVGPYLERLGL